MKKCKGCESEIATKAKQCPYCGEDQRSCFGLHRFLVTTFLVVFVSCIIAGAYDPQIRTYIHEQQLWHQLQQCGLNCPALHDHDLL